MKRFGSFILGVLVGFLLAIVISHIIGQTSNASDMTFFEQPGEVMNIKEVEVFQAFKDNTALARESAPEYLGLTVLVWNNENIHYYDGQKIRVSGKQHFRQVGLFRYHSALGDNTVPIISITD